MANMITGIRVVCSVLLLGTPVFSHRFYAVYLLAGVSDMVDGTVARLMKKVSDFGSKFDTVADFLFVICCMVKLLPVLIIPAWLVVWILVIAGIKLLNIYEGYRKNHRLAAVHSLLNKATGAVLFLFPFTLEMAEPKYTGSVICVFATIAAIQEGVLIRNGKTSGGYRPDPGAACRTMGESGKRERKRVKKKGKEKRMESKKQSF